jgi:hypothetical protein
MQSPNFIDKTVNTLVDKPPMNKGPLDERKQVYNAEH